MRIEGQTAAMVPFMQLSAPQPGSGLVFDDLLWATHHDAARMTPLLSFDAVGVLGLGGRPMVAGGVDVPSGGASAAAADAPPRRTSERPCAPDSSHMLRSSDVTALPVQVVMRAPVEAVEPTPAMTGVQPLPVLEAVQFSEGEGQIVEPSATTVVSRGFGVAAQVALPEAMVVTATVQEPFAFTNLAGRPGVNMSGAAPEGAKRGAAGTTFSFFLLRTTSRAAGQLSVAVSEADGALHVIAAAPNLSEEARQKIRGLAEDMAQEAGLPLGDFSLNGADLPVASKLSRSMSWPYRR